MSGVSHRVAVTDQYLISSCRNLLKQESGLTIRSTKPGFAYLGTLTEDIDFGSIRQVWAKENDGKLMVIAASDDAMTVWNEHNEGTRLKVNEDVRNSMINTSHVKTSLMRPLTIQRAKTKVTQMMTRRQRTKMSKFINHSLVK